MNQQDMKIVATAIRKLADAIEKCDESEYEAIMEGAFAVDLIVGEKRTDTPRASKVTSSDPDIIATARQLQATGDRDAGMRILDSSCVSKEQFIAVARHLDLPVQKREPIERIREKIIEATIGFRLRSQAIQGSK